MLNWFTAKFEFVSFNVHDIDMFLGRLWNIVFSTIYLMWPSQRHIHLVYESCEAWHWHSRQETDSDYIDKRCVNSTTVKLKFFFFLLFSWAGIPTFPLCVLKKLLSSDAWALAIPIRNLPFTKITKEFSKKSQDLFKLLDLEDPTLMMNT